MGAPLAQAVADDRRFLVAHVAARSEPLRLAPHLPPILRLPVTQTGALACAAAYPVVNWVRRDRSALRAPEMLRFVGRFAAAGAPLGATMAALRLAGEPDWFVRSCAAAVRADGDRVRRAADVFFASGAQARCRSG
jgi:hypothetical protein